MEHRNQPALEIQCPFFTGKEQNFALRKILCESPVPGSNLTLYFRRKQDQMDQLRIFCCCHYEKCEIYRAVMESKYQD